MRLMEEDIGREGMMGEEEEGKRKEDWNEGRMEEKEERKKRTEEKER